MCCAHTPLWDGTLLFQPSLGFSRHTRIQPTHMVSIIWPGFSLLSNLDLISALFQSSHLVCICKIGFCHHTWFQPFDIFSTLKWFQSSQGFNSCTWPQQLHLVSPLTFAFTVKLAINEAMVQDFQIFTNSVIPEVQNSDSLSFILLLVFRHKSFLQYRILIGSIVDLPLPSPYLPVVTSALHFNLWSK